MIVDQHEFVFGTLNDRFDDRFGRYGFFDNRTVRVEFADGGLRRGQAPGQGEHGDERRNENEDCVFHGDFLLFIVLLF
ncbi:hypothetical protein SDC9_96607 [bioreactor metagenome]|uniref:Uncharacterized protein n=1 Tax=bioreactor metagenome TaxID=1076179 RepID=A0A645AGB8_9ZZZZ